MISAVIGAAAGVIQYFLLNALVSSVRKQNPGRIMLFVFLQIPVPVLSLLTVAFWKAPKDIFICGSALAAVLIILSVIKAIFSRKEEKND